MLADRNHLANLDPSRLGVELGAATGIILLSMGGSQTVFSQENLQVLAREAIRIFWDGLSGGEPAEAPA